MAFDPTRRAPLPRGAIVDPARLSALDDLELLDTEPEEAFDRITRLASLCLDTPVALLSLVDHDRQFLKSSVGLPEGLTEMPVAGAFCRFSIENRAPLVVDDSADDPLVRADPSIPADGVRAYVGAPLITEAGHAVGTLCAIDTVRRRWTEREVRILTSLSELATGQIELRRLRGRQRNERDALRARIGAGDSLLEEANGRLRESRAQLGRDREDAVHRMARAVEARSEETGDHIARMSGLCAVLSLGLGFGAGRAELIRLAATLHDVGKIAVPDAILTKPGPLTADERTVMQDHVLLGYEMLGDSDDPVLALAASIALTHHERVDGGGYPRGLVGDQIPIEGRIAAVADVYDALTSARVYRGALHPRAAFAVMQEGRGTQFDARVLDALAAHVEIAIADAEAAGDGPPPW
jgi:HD-GYP domain-containing protein (c-di-GMP phosphodiesterase class II)